MLDFEVYESTIKRYEEQIETLEHRINYRKIELREAGVPPIVLPTANQRIYAECFDDLPLKRLEYQNESLKKELDFIRTYAEFPEENKE